MALELLKDVTVQEGLADLTDEAYSMKQNMVARLETPVLEDETDLWETFLDSKTPNLYGAVNQDNRHRFKIDNAFDLSSIVNATINPDDGSISIDEPTYTKSQGTEFIIIKSLDIDGAKADYTIRAKKYENIKEQLSKGKYEVSELAKAGGFKVNVQLKPDEIIKYKADKNIDELTWDDIEHVHDGWLEHAVGKNNASKDEYLEAAKLLAKYLIKAQEEDCFKGGTGMDFFVETDVDDYKLRPWFVVSSDDGSYAVGGLDFDYDGRFLRVAARKIDYSFLASTLKSPEFKPELLGKELDLKSLQNLALSQAAYAAKQQK